MILIRYAARRSRLRDACRLHLSADGHLLNRTLDLERWRRYLWVDSERRFAYCGIGKVGSTTWTRHLLRLKGEDGADKKYRYKEKLIQYNSFLGEFEPKRNLGTFCAPNKTRQGSFH